MNVIRTRDIKKAIKLSKEATIYLECKNLPSDDILVETLVLTTIELTKNESDYNECTKILRDIIESFEHGIKFYGMINDSYDLKEYFKKTCYSIEVKELWEDLNEDKRYYAIKETTPYGSMNVYTVYTKNGVLYNDLDEDIVLNDISFYIN